MEKRQILLWSFLLTGVLLLAQARNTNWVFGSGVWLHIGPDAVTSVPMTDTVSLRNACISDTAGQFLLLADDFGIRNALFDTIQGGSPTELGWNVPAGNYLVLPMPGEPEQYAVFINELPPSARAGMVLVDMAANGGAGAVLGGTTWFMEQTTAKLTATTDSAETGYWVLQHRDNNDAFLAFHLTADGLDPVPVISHAGTTYLPDTGPMDNMDRRGQMTFSFQGDRLGLVKNDVSVDTNKVELFNFNRSAGTLELWAEIWASSLTGGIIYPSTPYKMKGLDFDTTGQYLFVGTFDNAVSSNMVYSVQFDLLAAPPDSLWDQTIFWLGWGTPAPDYFDGRYGTSFAVDPYGFLLSHAWLSPTSGIFSQLIDRRMPPLSFSFNYNPVEAKIMGGFPSLCKRYVDNRNLTTAIPERTQISAIGLRPNPMRHRAALVFHGPAKPTGVIWRDALGRVVKESTVARSGPAFMLDRTGVPAGFYLVEIQGAKGNLGVVKVICE